MPWWLGIGAATAFGALTDSGLKSIFDSTSSTASIAIPFMPLILLAAVPCLVAACDVVALVRLRADGDMIAPPRRGEIVLAVVLAVVGFFAFFVFGLVIGLMTARSPSGRTGCDRGPPPCPDAAAMPRGRRQAPR
jgi:hypothetical protein